jgi:hypothetical protein
MNLVIYSPSTETHNSYLRRELESMSSDLVLEIHRSVYSLGKRLRRPVKDLVAVILSIAEERELLELLSIQDLLWDLPVILIIPAQDKRMIAQAHHFRPRFLTDANGDCSEIVSVLNRMLDNSRACDEPQRRRTIKLDECPVKHRTRLDAAGKGGLGSGREQDPG